MGIIIKNLSLAALALGILSAPLTANAAFWNKWFNKGKNDSTEVVEQDPEKVQQFSKIIHNATSESHGMVNVYKYEKDYYFEVPVTLMDKDLLVVNKLTYVPSELNDAGVNRGTNYQTQMVRLSVDTSLNKVTMRQQRPMPYAPAGDAINRSITENYISPIIENFEVVAHPKDSTSVLIKVTDLFNGQNTILNDVFNNINLGTSVDKDLSRIVEINAFDNNVIAYSELTTKVTEGIESVYVTVGVSCSIVLLREEAMPARLDTPRIGYFTTDRLFFSDNQQKVDDRKYITRWRLVPSDTAAYLRGEVVPPVKPIKFYIDNSVPEKWRPYLVEGITDWNAVFESIGFKDAIVVEQYPDSADTDDINYSTLTYAASTKMNAMGPSTLDPRTGEILEADIMWWHNVLSMLQQWITVQTGAINPAARTTLLPDSLMGDAMRFVVCHEVGHSLGLRHNMIASNAIPTDSLRSRSFTDRFNSTSASIMDYARFNYVAQPGDGVTHTSPHIGPYDYFAIEYAYRWYPDACSEKEGLQEVLDSHVGRMYKFSEAQPSRDAVDPRAQSEDLGDDAVYSSQMGIENLKTVMKNLIEWTTTGERGQTYAEASRLYYAVVNQWNYYMYHVLANVGGIYIENTTVGDGVKTFTYVEKDKQQEAVKFLIDNVFSLQDWLFNTEVSDYTFLNRNTPNGVVEYSPSQIFKNAQAYLFFDLLYNDRLLRMLENENRNGKDAYTPVDLMDDLHAGIFGVTMQGRIPTVGERNTQKLFVDALITAAAASEGIKVNRSIMGEQILNPDECAICPYHAADAERSGTRRELSFYGSQIARTSDAISVKRGELMRIKDLLERRSGTQDDATRYHYRDLILRIDNALEIK